MTDTIFAVSSGAPPAAIAVLRISGPAAFATGIALAGSLPEPRRAALRRLRDAAGALLDTALVLAFPGPNSATGEDLLELHLHGGRAIVRAVEAELDRHPDLRRAVAGEFTRRALGNGRIDLAQAEGLADLLAAETEAARRAALATVEGAVSRQARAWSAQLVAVSARAEALIDFADEDDVPASASAVTALEADIAALAAELAAAAARPITDRLHDGIRVVLAGPPNSGKSSLINAMAEREVAITTPIAGTTRDRIEVPVVRAGVAYLLTDTAGLRDGSDDPIEAIGIARAHEAIGEADLVIWLGDQPPLDPAMLAIHARADLPDRATVPDRLAVSSQTGVGVADLWEAVVTRTRHCLPGPDQIALNRRQRDCVREAANILREENGAADLILLAECLRLSRRAIDGMIGIGAVDSLLDDLFSRFCIGK